MAPLRTRSVVPLVLILAAAVTSPDEPPTFGAGVHLVALDLVARDRKGNTIRDLRPDEVEVHEDGVRQPVTEFRAVSLGREARADVAALVAPESAPAHPVPGPLAPARPRVRVNLVAMVFDQLSVDGRSLASKAARDLLVAQLDPAAFVAVFRIDGRLKLVESFTLERARLLESIDGAEEVERTLRGNRSLDGPLAVVHGLRDLPGRKTLVYFSEGLQVPPWLEDPFRGLASEANRANVSIYSVDVRGLRVAAHMDDARALLDQAVMISQSQRLSGGNWHGVTREQAREFEAVEATLRMNAQGTLDDLSKATGGFLIGDSNDLALGLRRLGEDISTVTSEPTGISAASACWPS